MSKEQFYDLQQVSGPVQAGRWWLGPISGGTEANAAPLQTMATQVFVALVSVMIGMFLVCLLGLGSCEGSVAAIFWLITLTALAMCGFPRMLLYHLQHNPRQLNSIPSATLALGAGLALLDTPAGVLATLVATSYGYPPKAVAFLQVCMLLTAVCLIAMLLKRVLGAFELRLLANQLTTPPQSALEFDRFNHLRHRLRHT